MRVECFSKISAMLRPSSAREDSGAAFRASARSSSARSSSGVELGPGEQVARQDGQSRLGMAMRVLTWNLFHGRAVPPAGRNLQAAFARALAGWEWDVALLQEVPPWWPPALARACDAEARTALTSRNALLALRRAIAIRAPDLIKSNGGGANAILVRTQFATIVDHRRVLLRRWPERRVCHAVALSDGTWCANLHAQVHSPARAAADIALARLRRCAGPATGRSLLGGDFNVRHARRGGLRATRRPRRRPRPRASAAAPPAASRLRRAAQLSDHAAVIVTVLPQPAGDRGVISPPRDPQENHAPHHHRRRHVRRPRAGRLWQQRRRQLGPRHRRSPRPRRRRRSPQRHRSTARCRSR